MPDIPAFNNHYTKVKRFAYCTTLRVHTASDGLGYTLHVNNAGGVPCTSVLPIVERKTPCTSILLAVEMDHPTHTSTLLAVEKDGSCTFVLLLVLVKGIHPGLPYCWQWK
jgi:hypothetical protein